MTTAKDVVVLLSFCVAFATAKTSADISFDLLSVVEQQTAEANKALSALPATCTSGSAKSINNAKVEMYGNIASCGVSAIIKDIAYIMIDSADFGSAVWADGLELVADVKACLKDDNILLKVQCLAEAFSSSSDAVHGIWEAIIELVKQLLVIIPDIEEQIKICQGKSTHEYKLFLDGLVKKANTC